MKIDKGGSLKLMKHDAENLHKNFQENDISSDKQQGFLKSLKRYPLSLSNILNPNQISNINPNPCETNKDLRSFSGQFPPQEANYQKSGIYEEPNVMFTEKRKSFPSAENENVYSIPSISSFRTPLKRYIPCTILIFSVDFN